MVAIVECSGRAGPQQQRHAASQFAPSSSALHGGTVNGDLRLHEFTSHVFGNTRLLRVLVPDGYDDPVNRHRLYPVLYLNDGQSLFDSATSSSKVEWQVDETVRRLVREGRIPPIIVVGIDNGGAQRAAEYLPYPHWVDAKLAVEPRGKQYPDFLLGEVMPFIDSHYRTIHDPAYTALGGSSLGGLVSLYTVVAHPGRFGGVLIESPTLYVDRLHVLRDAANVKFWPSRISLGVGTNEGNRGVCPDPALPNRMADDVKSLAILLKTHGVDSSRVRVVIDSCATHSVESWRRRFPDALAFLFHRAPGTNKAL